MEARSFFDCGDQRDERDIECSVALPLWGWGAGQGRMVAVTGWVMIVDDAGSLQPGVNDDGPRELKAAFAQSVRYRLG